MTESLTLVFAGTAGGILGTIFFGGLWWTVHRGLLSARPARWFLGSLLVRMGVVLAGLYFVGHGDWRRLAAALMGFVVARSSVIYLTRSSVQSPIVPLLKESHAS